MSRLEEYGHESHELDRLQLEAAKNAQTIGGFRASFAAAIDRALHQGTVDAGEAKQRRSAVDATTTEGDITLDSTPDGVLGYNRIGAGRAGINLSRSTFAYIRSAEEAKEIKRTIWHEHRHGEQVQFQGELVLDGAKVEHGLLYEGDAEIASNQAVGEGMHTHRKGQPNELYKEGQDAVTALHGIVKKELIDRVFTQTGNLSELQTALDEKSRGRSQNEYAIST